MHRRTALVGVVGLLSGCTGLWNGDLPSHKNTDPRRYPQAILSFEYDRSAGQVTVRFDRAAGFTRERIEEVVVTLERENDVQHRTVAGEQAGALPIEDGDSFEVPVEPGTELGVVYDTGRASGTLEEYEVPE